MAIINFSVPDEVKQAFNEDFSQEDKSAIEESRIKKQRHNAIEVILALREKQVLVSIDDISNAREELRK
ncbi:MAG: hypothetical protein KAJ63_00360 [Methyloprofundus sp.]|nr:hypothetical protein [Methyloprofundus sp.]